MLLALGIGYRIVKRQLCEHKDLGPKLISVLVETSEELLTLLRLLNL